MAERVAPNRAIAERTARRKRRPATSSAQPRKQNEREHAQPERLHRATATATIAAAATTTPGGAGRSWRSHHRRLRDGRVARVDVIPSYSVGLLGFNGASNLEGPFSGRRETQGHAIVESGAQFIDRARDRLRYRGTRPDARFDGYRLGAHRNLQGEFHAGGVEGPEIAY